MQLQERAALRAQLDTGQRLQLPCSLGLFYGVQEVQVPDGAGPTILYGRLQIVKRRRLRFGAVTAVDRAVYSPRSPCRNGGTSNDLRSEDEPTPRR